MNLLELAAQMTVDEADWNAIGHKNPMSGKSSMKAPNLNSVAEFIGVPLIEYNTVEGAMECRAAVEAKIRVMKAKALFDAERNRRDKLEVPAADHE